MATGLKIKMNRSVLAVFLEQCGWKMNRYGNYHKDIMRRRSDSGKPVLRKYRIRLQELVARVEVQVTIGGQNEWVRVDGDYYRNIVSDKPGQIRIGRFLITEPAN